MIDSPNVSPRLLVGLVLAMALTASAPRPARAEGNVRWKSVENVDFDWTGTGVPDTFRLEIPEGWTDPGDATRLTVLREGKAYFTKDGLTVVAPEKDLAAAGGASPSKYLRFVRLRSSDKDLYALFQDYAWESSPETLYVLSPTRGLIWSRGFMLREIRDVDGDGQVEIIGYGRTSQCEDESEEICEYNPLLAMHLDGEKLVISDTISKELNEKNHYPWRGAELVGNYDKSTGEVISDEEAQKRSRKRHPL